MILTDLDNIIYNLFASGEITLVEYLKYESGDKNMNYEEKYKQALERAKVYHTGGSISDAHITEVIFPELKEFDDERIRKGLVKAFGTIGKKDWGGLIVRDILAWLEKQQSFDKDKLAKGFLRSVATSIMNWLDANTSEGKMCLSNMECEDIENAVLNADWSKVYAYMRKKLDT